MKIVINGIEIKAESGQTILEVAKENNISIPSLCDHPQLAPFGGCRICLVEIKGIKGYVPSCSTFIDEGMEVRTDTLRLQKIRRQILGLILTEHPDACLVCTEKENCDDHKSTIRKVGEVTGCVLCPNNGRCELQEAVEAIGISRVDFPSVYRELEVIKTDPFFERNYNLCILCGRCVRVCREIRGASAVSFAHRGSQTVVGTVLDKPLLEAGCQFCGACVDVCPTGALTEKILKYEDLPDNTAKTICAFCSLGCELEIKLREGKILNAVPSAEGRVNKGQACVKGRFGIRDVVYSSKRILKPLIRRKKHLEEVSWEETFDFVARNLKKFRGKEIGMIASPQICCEDSYLFYRFAREALKAENVGSTALHSPSALYREMGRKNRLDLRMNFNAEDISEAEVLFLDGTDLSVSHPLLWLEILKALQKGAKLIVASPVESVSTRAASLWLETKPGTEPYLFGILSKLLLERIQDEESLKKKGFRAFKDSLDGLKMSQAAEATGVDEACILEAVRLLLVGRSCFLYGMGSVQNRWGTQNLTALWNLALLTQGRIIPLGTENNLRGLLEIGRRFNTGGLSPFQILAGIRKKTIRALYLMGPLPYPHKIKLDFLVVQDSYMNEAAAYADAVLPAATFVESEGTFINGEGRILHSKKVIEPVGEAAPDGWIISQLGQRWGLKSLQHKDRSEIMKDISKAIPAFQGFSQRSKKDKGEGFIMENGRGENRFFPVDISPFLLRQSQKYPFSLYVNYSHDHYRSLVLSREIKGLRLLRDPRWIRMNPEDAGKSGFTDGDAVIVETPSGKCMGSVKISDSVPSGILAANFLWNEDLDFSVTRLIHPRPRDSRAMEFLPVRIKRGK